MAGVLSASFGFSRSYADNDRFDTSDPSRFVSDLMSITVRNNSRYKSKVNFTCYYTCYILMLIEFFWWPATSFYCGEAERSRDLVEIWINADFLWL